MSVSGPRDPVRNRQFYEDLLSREEQRTGRVAKNSTPTISPTDVPSLVPSPSSHEVVRLVTSADVGLPTTAEVMVPAARPPLQPVPQLVNTRQAVSIRTRPRTTQAPILNSLNNVWDGLREMLGINHQAACLNGGTRIPGGRCHCPKLYEGYTCERRVCLNGGRLTKTTVGPVAYECKCPSPQFIEGVHCETVRCANQAPLVSANGTWTCDCSDRMFYKGEFCETFSAPYAVMAVPLACLVVFLVCCFLCRIDWCPRRRNQSRSRGSAAAATRAGQQQRRRAAAARPTPAERAVRSGARRPNTAQEYLLPHERGLVCAGRGAAAYPANAGPPYVIRLDTIPTFNPNMIGGVDAPISSTSKPMEPPPSYDQAILSPAAPEPPRYTERPSQDQSLPNTPQPPPPNRQPPAPPTS